MPESFRKALKAFKKYVRSKFPIFDPHPPCSSLFVSHIPQQPPSPQRAFTLVSPSPRPSQKKFHDLYEFSNENRGVKREKRINLFVNSKDQCFLHSYIYNNNINSYKFIKNVQ